MSRDPRLLTADLRSLVHAAGFRLSSYGGGYASGYSLTLDGGPTIPGGSWSGLNAAFLDWLDSSGHAVPTFADVQIATLAVAVHALNEAAGRDREATRRMAEIAASAIAREFAEPDCIKVWRFYEAPESFQQLSGHGGDEDWIALVPPGFGWVGWLDSGGPFGCCSVSEHALPNGWTVHIGAHS